MTMCGCCTPPRSVYEDGHPSHPEPQAVSAAYFNYRIVLPEEKPRMPPREYFPDGTVIEVDMPDGPTRFRAGYGGDMRESWKDWVPE